MMVRMIGAVLVAAGAAWTGFQAASGLRVKVRAIRDMSAGLATLERELELNNPPLPRLLAQGAEYSRGTAKALFQGCVQGVDNLAQESFSSLWGRLTAHLTELGEDGQAILTPLGDILGRYGGPRQLEALSAARRRLEELAAQLEEDSHRRGKVYQALGLSGGAFLVILLL